MNSCRSTRPWAATPAWARPPTAPTCRSARRCSRSPGRLPFTAPAIHGHFEKLGIPVPENISTPSHARSRTPPACTCRPSASATSSSRSARASSGPTRRTTSRPAPTPSRATSGWATTRRPARRRRPARDELLHPNGDGSETWHCTATNSDVPTKVIKLLQARTRNDAAGWERPDVHRARLRRPGGVRADRPLEDPRQLHARRHARQAVRGADEHGYKMVVTISMSNDYNGYIATYRDYMGRDHYRKALTGWGPHSSDYMATRLVRIGRALKGDEPRRRRSTARPTPSRPRRSSGVRRQGGAEQVAEDAKVRSVGERRAPRSRPTTPPCPTTASAPRRRQAAQEHRALRRGDLQLGRREQLQPTTPWSPSSARSATTVACSASSAARSRRA